VLANVAVRGPTPTGPSGASPEAANGSRASSSSPEAAFEMSAAAAAGRWCSTSSRQRSSPSAEILYPSTPPIPEPSPAEAAAPGLLPPAGLSHRIEQVNTHGATITSSSREVLTGSRSTTGVLFPTSSTFDTSSNGWSLSSSTAVCGAYHNTEFRQP
jgi:hypothetical protein